MAKESLHGLMVSFMKENLQIIGSLAKVYIDGQMEVYTKDRLRMGLDMAMGYTKQIKLHIKASGNKAKNKEKVKFISKVDLYFKETLKTI